MEKDYLRLSDNDNNKYKISPRAESTIDYDDKAAGAVVTVVFVAIFTRIL